MTDRAKQALALMALEPQWEALFESNSFGFRPGRSAHDAIEAIYKSIGRKDKFVLDADIAKCFDRINHDAILRKLETYRTMKRQIAAWLKAGIMDGKETLFPKEGTPQGGVISPFLANVALHGLQNHLKEWARTLPLRDAQSKVISPSNKERMFNIIRYADDFVLLHSNLEVVELGRNVISEWFKPLGLELHPEKTRLAHTLNSINKNPTIASLAKQTKGFEFLGFTVRQYPVGRYRTKRSGLGFRTLIKPSLKAIKRHLTQISETLKQTKKIEALVLLLNPIIRGWANYYRTVVSSQTFSKVEKLTMTKLISWAKRKHPTRSGKCIYNKYLKRVNRRLRFGYSNPTDQVWTYILTHSATKIVRHTKVSLNRSPYDGDWTYWLPRGSRLYQFSLRHRALWKSQKGKCAWCNLYFMPSDIIELDHIISRKDSGSNQITNLQLLHGHCHDQKTAAQSKMISKQVTVSDLKKSQ
jgi:RNA-directed DNA polymerase